MSADRRVGVGDGGKARSRINYPYAQGWGLADRPPSEPLRKRVYPQLARLPEGSLVLNLGSGDGNFELNAPHPRRRPYSFVSVDQDHVAIGRLSASINGGPDRAFVGDITALDLGETKVAAVVASRVLHALDAADQEAVARIAAAALEPGGTFHVTALADKDWKAREAARRGIVAADTLVNYHGIMNLAAIGRSEDEPWNAFAFTPHRFYELAAAAGLEVVGKIREFTEPTSFPHLADAHPEVTYYYAALRKPAEGERVRRRGRQVRGLDEIDTAGIAEEARSIVDLATERK